MTKWHYLTVAIVLTLVYLAGVKYPSTGQNLLSKLGM